MDPWQVFHAYTVCKGNWNYFLLFLYILNIIYMYILLFFTEKRHRVPGYLIIAYVAYVIFSRKYFLEFRRSFFFVFLGCF